MWCGDKSSIHPLDVRHREGVLVLTPGRAVEGPAEIRCALLGGVFSAPDYEEFQDSRQGRARRIVMNSPERVVVATLFESSPFLHLEIQIKNPGEVPVTHDLLSVGTLTIEAHSEKTSESWKALGSGGMAPIRNVTNSFASLAVADPVTRNGVVCAWLTQHRGLGTFLPTYANGKLRVAADLEFGNLRIAPHGTRDTDQLILGFFSDVRIGLECYADEVAALEGIHLKPKTGVYCSWYHRRNELDGASNQQIVEDNSSFAQDHLQAFGLEVYQIDDHWQAADDGRPFTTDEIAQGPLKTFTRSNANFPGGMKALAAGLRKKGFVPGIWFMPFAADSNAPAETFPPEIFVKDVETGQPLPNTRWSGTTIDATSPAGVAFLRDRFRRFREWGFDYIKVDGLHVGTPSHNLYVHRVPSGKSLRPAVLHDPDLTFIEAFRLGLALLREEMPGAFILGCSSTQNMGSFAPVFGFVDACRVGPDNDAAARGDWNNVTFGAEFAGNSWFLNNRVWHNDPDPLFVRESISIEKARWMASWVAVSGVMNSTSEIYRNLPPDRLDLIKRTLPVHNCFARPVDILDRQKPSVWIVGNDRQHIVGFFNWEESSPVILSESLESLGLDASKAYEAFDYWGNQLLAPIQGVLTANLPGAGCQVLSLREVSTRPQVVSTSRQITQGLVDLVSESWDAELRTLRGTSRVVAGDSYELRIVCPEGLAPVASSPFTFVREERLLRAAWNPTHTGEWDWSVAFE